MDEKAARLWLWAWVGTSALLGYWFAWVAISAVFHAETDPGGNLVLFSSSAGHTVYPFTYAAVAIALPLLAYFIYLQDRGHRDSFLLAPVAAYVSCVGVINLYEQLFVVGVVSSTHSTFWWTYYWGAPGNAIFSFLGLTWLFASAPWWHRANLRLAAPMIATFLAGMALWMALGFPGVGSGAGWVYALNTITRISSELVPVILAIPPSLSIRIAARFPTLGRWAWPSVAGATAPAPNVV